MYDFSLVAFKISGCFQDFFGFQQFDLDVCLGKLLWVYPAWGSLNFMDPFQLQFLRVISPPACVCSGKLSSALKKIFFF